MNKLSLLRAHILSIPDELKIEAEDLIVFADNGKIKSSSDGTNKHFEYEFNANIIITNYSGNPDMLVFWLLVWMEANQPNHGDEPIDFDADILNDDSVDFSLTLALTETIKVEESEEGIKLFHAEDPNNNPVLLPATDWTISGNNQELASWIQDE